MTEAAAFHSSSFRDPAGRLFYRDGELYRQVNKAGNSDYEAFISSGLYEELLGIGAIIAHKPASLDLAIEPDNAAQILKPDIIPYLSWPYEWCFLQLQDAALLTLDVQRRALSRNMILKDASAYNIQFIGAKPVLIDTLSFTEYHAGQAWQAYRQFCQHFLAPLCLMSYVDPRLGRMLREYIDGIPLDLAVKLLPGRAFLKYGVFAHVYLHSKSQQKYSDVGVERQLKSKPNISKTALIALLDGIQATIRKLKPPSVSTEWENYYQQTNYSDPGMQQKLAVVEEILTGIEESPETILDLGANNGRFSLLASKYAGTVIAQDIDHNAVSHLYLKLRTERKYPGVLPLVQDLSNPSPTVGWAQAEREGLMQRGMADVVMALALIHHLVIGNNVPLHSVVSFLAAMGKHVILEFVPKGDSQVDRMLVTRDDIFGDYTQENFELALAPSFTILNRYPLADSQRVIYSLINKKFA